jgi:hypothetical protein
MPAAAMPACPRLVPLAIPASPDQLSTANSPPCPMHCTCPLRPYVRLRQGGPSYTARGQRGLPAGAGLSSAQEDEPCNSIQRFSLG